MAGCFHRLIDLQIYRFIELLEVHIRMKEDDTLMRIGVIGAGTMGSGVAQGLAQSKIQTVVLDVNDEKLEHSKAEIQHNLRFRSLFGATEGQEDAKAIMERIQFTTDYSSLEEVSFVIENATENWEVKKDIHERLDRICNDATIFMVNTSCISITRIAALTNRADKVIGTHFMNP